MRHAPSGNLFKLVEQAGRLSEPLARYWYKQIRAVRCSRIPYILPIFMLLITTTQLRTKWTGLGYFAAARGMPSRLGAWTCPITGGQEMHYSWRWNVCACGLRHGWRSGGWRIYRHNQAVASSTIFLRKYATLLWPFDGFAIDLWAAAVVLFFMLTQEADPGCRMVMRGGLSRMLRSWNRETSSEATNLLQKMLQEGTPGNDCLLRKWRNTPG